MVDHGIAPRSGAYNCSNLRSFRVFRAVDIRGLLFTCMYHKHYAANNNTCIPLCDYRATRHRAVDDRQATRTVYHTTTRALLVTHGATQSALPTVRRHCASNSFLAAHEGGELVCAARTMLALLPCGARGIAMTITLICALRKRLRGFALRAPSPDINSVLCTPARFGLNAWV